MCLALGISPTLFTFSFVCLITSIWSWCVIPETRGLTLTQVNHAAPTIPIIKCFSSIKRCSAFHACKKHLDITVLLRKKGNSRRTRGRGEPSFLLFSFKSCSMSRLSSNSCDIRYSGRSKITSHGSKESDAKNGVVYKFHWMTQYIKSVYQSSLHIGIRDKASYLHTKCLDCEMFLIEN